MSKRYIYPFVPKSTANLLPGQFWALPLSNGLFGCGRVIQLAPSSYFFLLGARVSFLAGVLDWVSPLQPTSESISGAKCIAQGQAHIKAITETGGEILGHRNLEFDEIVPWLFRGASYWKNSFVQEGLVCIRPQVPQDEELKLASLFIKLAWYHNLIKIAEERFVPNNA
ncbi:MAG: hypothetical protein IPN42_04135 [Methylococcaceae bacterium]|nr:hypothetical protein [Methylococcaceae bacterium]